MVTSTDPLAALEIFRLNPSGFEPVVTDLMTPKMTGVDLPHQIRAGNQRNITGHLICSYVVILEGYSDESTGSKF